MKYFMEGYKWNFTSIFYILNSHVHDSRKSMLKQYSLQGACSMENCIVIVKLSTKPVLWECKDSF
jgi:hypothetical protein